MEDIAWIKYALAHAGAPGHNQYGVPLHACHGHRHDARYWTRISHQNHLKGRP